MDFTNEELWTLSEGVIRLIQDMNKAMSLVHDKATQKMIQENVRDLQKLNNKICTFLKGE